MDPFEPRFCPMKIAILPGSPGSSPEESHTMPTAWGYDPENCVNMVRVLTLPVFAVRVTVQTSAVILISSSI